MSERKCHPEKRFHLIALSLISGWCSQDRFDLTSLQQYSNLLCIQIGLYLIHELFFLVWGWMTLIIDTIVEKYYTIITCFAFRHVNLFCKTSLRTFKGFHSLLYIQIIFLDESGPKVIDNRLSHNSSKMSTSNAIFLTLKCYFAFPLVFCRGKMTPLDEALQERILPLTLPRSSPVCCDVANCEIAINNFNILSNFV